MVEKKEITEALEFDLTLIIIEPLLYSKVVEKILSIFVSEKGMSGVYFTSNQPCNYLMKKLENNIDLHKVKFVDAVSHLIQENLESTNFCTYLKSPRDLTAISLEINQQIEAIKSVEGRPKFLIFDSFSTLALYNEEEIIKKYAHYIANKSRRWRKTKTVLISTSDKEKVVAEISQFCDKVLRIKELDY